MKHKILTLVGLLVLLLVIAGSAKTTAADGVPIEFPRNLMAPEGLDPMDLSVEMLGEKEIAIRKRAAQIGSAAATAASPIGDPATVGDEYVITVSDSGMDFDYDETFVVLLDGTYGIILIEKAAFDGYDPATDEYVFPNPNGCWRPEDRISHSMLTYLLGEFDSNIYPTVGQVFGEPLPRGEEGQKTWILIFNIRDASYYDCGQTSYVAGYFSASESAENNKNIMHIDSYDWANRTGPDAARPFMYEGTFAHEFEHLVHFDIDPDEPSWVDEGLADLSGFLCGYGHSESHIAYYMVYHPFTALTFWGSGLEDYGASYLFQLYLYEKFGGAAFTSALVQDQADGIEGIENTLTAFGHREDFDTIFDRWTIANYLDDTRKAGGIFGYEPSSWAPSIAGGIPSSMPWAISGGVRQTSHPSPSRRPGLAIRSLTRPTTIGITMARARWPGSTAMTSAAMWLIAVFTSGTRMRRPGPGAAFTRLLTSRGVEPRWSS
jgi:hypothetical protein